MNFAVQELPRAKEDKQAILEWLLERSRQGAAAWLDAYDDALGLRHCSAATKVHMTFGPNCP